MLAQQQIAHFRLFGFVVVRRLLSAAEAVVLRAEVDAALADAYGDGYGVVHGDDGGVAGNYLAALSDRTPFAASLVADDPRCANAAEQLIGARVLPFHAQAVRLLNGAAWHSDTGLAIPSIKLIAYLQPLTAATGALRLLPFSQDPDVAQRMAGYWRENVAVDDETMPAHIAAFPGHVAQTDPGDVIAFDERVFHASWGGHDRVAWSAEYAAAPDTDELRRQYLQHVSDMADYTCHHLDHDRWPVWRDWRRNAPGHPRRAALIAEMTALGVFDQPGVDLGDVPFL